ncbi:E3 SUMO-protein ligase ZBED1-like [Xyrichtys novacula]|uniref:E3 SUMO-protein ligase ZBED1-like n=1 Tax=Xyrichtys novacula TaxID=13765 RepID=A0AAV1F8Q0_XYRNO|nr:E3 SUMO-protein ligase ZBED1-like [Xyrichtys novacula]
MKTEERHFADTCAEHFMHVAGEWDIEGKVSTLTTDSARNMIAASKQLPFEHMPCAAHLLQRAITVSLQHSPFDSALAKCRKVVGHFKHSAPNAAELEKMQDARKKPKEALTQDVSTRWNSTLEMIRSILRNQEPLSDALALHPTKVTMPTAAELDKLQKYVTELLGGENFVSCSAVLPALSHLSRVMEVSEDDPAYMAKFKETFTADLEQRKEKTNLPWLKVATALDPRFKDLKCLSKPERAEVWRSITDLLKEERPAQPEQPTVSVPPKKRLALMFESSSDEEDYLERCLERYRAEPTIDMEDCPQQWWADHEGAHSMMAGLARKYLATPATSPAAQPHDQYARRFGAACKMKGTASRIIQTRSGSRKDHDDKRSRCDMEDDSSASSPEASSSSRHTWRSAGEAKASAVTIFVHFPDRTWIIPSCLCASLLSGPGRRLSGTSHRLS